MHSKDSTAMHNVSTEAACCNGYMLLHSYNANSK